MKRNLFLMFGFRPVYDNDGGEGGNSGTSGGNGTVGGTGGGNGTGGGTSGGTGTGGATGGGGGGDDQFAKMNFTDEQQKFINSKIAEERRKGQDQNKTTIAELQKLQQAQGTTEAHRKELQERINQLQQQYMSKEELAKQEATQREREYQETLKTARSEADLWKNRFQDSTILRSLQDGAIEFEAYNPNQLVDMLWQKTKLVEQVDEDGKATGNLVPRVHLTEADEDGKVKTLDLSVREALQKMKNTPEKYGNLFKSTLAGGLGGNGSPNGGTGRKKDPAKMSPQEWHEARKKDPNFGFVNK